MNTTLQFVLLSPASNARTVIATLTWPAELAADAIVFIRDNLLTERLGSPERAHALMQSGRLAAIDRPKFLAEKSFFPPEPPEKLASAVDLEDFVAEFSVGLRALRAAPPDADLLLEWS